MRHGFVLDTFCLAHPYAQDEGLKVPCIFAVAHAKTTISTEYLTGIIRHGPSPKIGAEYRDPYEGARVKYLHTAFGQNLHRQNQNSSFFIKTSY